MTADFRKTYGHLLATLPANARLRLAPTPSGYLHRGNALNFYLNWHLARTRPAARLLLRIDDLDADRKRPEFVQDIFDSLHWLGIDWDEGPENVADFERNWSQQTRLPIYNQALESLRTSGHLFACKKSRRDLDPFGGAYPAQFREQQLSFDEPDVAWRIRTPDNFPLPDFVVRRRDGIPAYQIASVIDDLHFGITHVIRGADLESSTCAQLFLAKCLGRDDEFNKITMLHHPLMLDAQGEKLSKSAGAASLHLARQRGIPADEIIREFGLNLT